ncbi:MAG: DUF563 domain-containing protein [Magnetococcales bacterium]|nr:DUF563 domain-containing protein [Magnetococcales bacterium]
MTIQHLMVPRIRVRSAYIIAMVLANKGYSHPLISIALRLGGSLYNNPDEVNRSVALRMQVDDFPSTDQALLFDQFIAPLLTYLFNPVIDNPYPFAPEILLGILRDTVPRFRSILPDMDDWNRVPPELSLEQMRRQGRDPSRLILPLTGQPRERRRVVVVRREAIFSGQTWPRPFHVEQRLVAAMCAYGWQAELCLIQGADLIDDYRRVSITCQQQKAELLILEEEMVLTRSTGYLSRPALEEMLTLLRFEMPDMKLATVLLDAASVESSLLLKASRLIDFFLDVTVPALPVWDDPAFAGKILHLPLPQPEKRAIHTRPLTPDMVFSGHDTGYSRLWMSAANHAGVRILRKPELRHLNTEAQLGYWRELAEEPCHLFFAGNERQSAPATDWCFEVMRGGGLVVHEATPNMHACFVPGEHYLEFSTLNELRGIAQFLVAHRDEAEEIRSKGTTFARENYAEEKIIHRLDTFLRQQPVGGRPEVSQEAKLVAFSYVSVKKWCRQVLPERLLHEDGNVCAHFADRNAFQPTIRTPGHHLQKPGYQDRFHEAGFGAWFPYSEIDYGALLHNFDMQAERIRSHPPFIAKLENVRIEFPGFGVFLDRQILMEESFHNKEFTHNTLPWWGYNGTRRNQTFDIHVGTGWDGETTFPGSLEVNYYVDHGTDQYEEGPAILLSGASWANYHHWFVEMLPRLWCLTEIPELRSLPVIVRAPLLSFQEETLNALGITSDRIRLFTGRMLHVKNLIFPSIIAPMSHSWQEFSWLRENLLPAFGVDTSVLPKSLLYLSRRNLSNNGDTSRDRIINEAQLEMVLQARGFQVVHMETRNMKEKLEIINSARLIITPPGAGTVNIVFAQPGTTLIEVIPYTPLIRTYHAIYAAMNGCRHLVVPCHNGDRRKDEIVVDLPILLQFVDKILEEFAENDQNSLQSC